VRLTRKQLTNAPLCAECFDYVDNAKIVKRKRGWVHVTNNSVRCPGQGDDDTDDRATPLRDGFGTVVGLDAKGSFIYLGQAATDIYLGQAATDRLTPDRSTRPDNRQVNHGLNGGTTMTHNTDVNPVELLTDYDRWTIAAEYIVSKLTLVIDNTAAFHAEATEAAHRSVIEDNGTHGDESDRANWEAYAEAYRNGETIDYARNIGDRVADVIGTWVDMLREAAESAGQLDILMLIMEPNDFGNDTMQRLIGTHYLPEPADVAEALSITTEDTDTDEGE
jgi:hypothetical protein